MGHAAAVTTQIFVVLKIFTSRCYIRLSIIIYTENITNRLLIALFVHQLNFHLNLLQFFPIPTVTAAV